MLASPRPTRPPLSRAEARGAWIACAMTALLLLSACGGGEAPPPSDGGDGVVAPSNLAYATSPALYRTDTPIPPNVLTAQGDPADAFSVSPTLPAGLVLDPSTGHITGTCTAPAAAADYVVTASNGGGEAQTTVNIEVLWHESKSLLPKAAPTDADLRHFLDRTHFGFSQTHYDTLQQLGLAAYVDAMTTFGDTGQLEADARSFYLVDGNDPNGDFPSQNDIARYYLYMIMVNSNPFQEMLSFHWLEHFAANTQVLRDNTGDDSLHYFVDYVNLFRHDGAGNLKQLMLDMALQPAMLVFLDNILNRDGNINENFGREWFELFAMGVDVDYTQEDIVEASRAFTGFRNRNDPTTGKDFVEFDPNRHDDEEKTVLGVTIPAQANGTGEVPEFDQVVDITFNHNEAGTGHSRVGQWIARSLLRYFVYDDPPQNVVNEIADGLRGDNWEIKPTLMKIFQSEAFFSALARKALVKGPVEHVAGFMRATNLLGDPAQIDVRLLFMGHRPTQPPGVDGWPGGTQWLSGQGMVDRANALNYLTEQAQGIQRTLGISATPLLPNVPGTSQEAVASLAQRLGITLSPGEAGAAGTYLDTERNGDGTVDPSPFDALDPVADAEEIENRVRGLLWILGQHPTYVIR